MPKPKSVPVDLPTDPAMIMSRLHAIVRVLVPGGALLLGAVLVGAQEIPGLPEPAALAQQNLRPYWHVFLAYAIVITAIGGWTVSIARRLRSVEDRLID